MGDIKERYYVIIAATCERIEYCFSEEEAWETIREIEEDDKAEGTFEPNRYEVEEIYSRDGEEVDRDEYSYQLTGIRNERRFDWDED